MSACVCVINLSQSVENNEEKARLSASFFVTFFREKKVEFVSSLKRLYCGASARSTLCLSLSLAFSFAKNTLECSFVVYRLSDFVWWWFGRLLLRRTCAFSLVKVKVLFFPLYRRRALCTATHKSKALISVLFLVVKVAFETKRRFFSNAHTRSPTIVSFAS